MDEKNQSPIENCNGLLTFKVAGQDFCTDMANIVEIINPIELDQEENICSEHPHVNLGIIKIPIIDLYQMFGFSSKPRGIDDRIIIVEIENQFFGFMVEKISNIYSLDKELKNEIEFISRKGLIHLAGILKFRKKDLFYLDFLSIVSDRLK
ncbi:MAG: chemotaxis protein CheW [Ignavibacteriaceae bacterium]